MRWPPRAPPRMRHLDHSEAVEGHLWDLGTGALDQGQSLHETRGDSDRRDLGLAVTMVSARRPTTRREIIMWRPFTRVRPTDAERTQPMPGDDTMPDTDVAMDRGFTVPGTPAQVWPWIAQLGKGRGRWYLPARFEGLLPRSGRGLRHIDPRWQSLQPGDVVPDYGRGATFPSSGSNRPTCSSTTPNEAGSASPGRSP